MATATATAPDGTMLPGSDEVRALTTRSGRDRRSNSEGQAGPANGLSTNYLGGSVALADSSGLFGPIKEVFNQPVIKKSLPLIVIALMLLRRRTPW